MYEKLTKCPNFTCFLPEKLSQYPNFYYICPKNSFSGFPIQLSPQSCQTLKFLHTAERKLNSSTVLSFLHGGVLSIRYLNSEFDAAVLHETVDFVKSQPVVVVACRWSKPVTICRPVLVERHRTPGDLPLHNDPAVDSQERHGDSRVGAQSSSRRLLVLSHVIWEKDTRFLVGYYDVVSFCQ